MANAYLQHFHFLSLFLLWPFLKCTSREDHQASSLMVTTHPPPPPHIPSSHTPSPHTWQCSCERHSKCSSSALWPLAPYSGSWGIKKSFFIGILCWPPWISQARSKGLSKNRPARLLINTTTILRRKKALAEPAW